jgi:hypothetical protein
MRSEDSTWFWQGMPFPRPDKSGHYEPAAVRSDRIHAVGRQHLVLATNAVPRPDKSGHYEPAVVRSDRIHAVGRQHLVLARNAVPRPDKSGHYEPAGGARELHALWRRV